MGFSIRFGMCPDPGGTALHATPTPNRSETSREEQCDYYSQTLRSARAAGNKSTAGARVRKQFKIEGIRESRRCLAA